MKRTESLELFKSRDGKVAIEVPYENETVWMTQQQMSVLFQTTQQVISFHITNIYKDKELDKKATHKENLLVRQEGSRIVQRKVDFYNLDLIISVGYRVNSKRGVEFRQWASTVLKQHLIEGYTINQQRLNRNEQGLKELRTALSIAERYVLKAQKGQDEIAGILKIISSYSRCFDLLDAYDYQSLPDFKGTAKKVNYLTLDEAKEAIERIRSKEKPSSLFGRGGESGLEGSLLAIQQTAGGKDVYPSLYEKAASLLYLLVKNHHFVDGNKRIAAYLFALFLDKNNLLFQSTGNKRIEDGTLVAITLMIAESRPTEKKHLTRLIANLI